MGDVNDSPEMKKHFEEMMKELGSVVDQQLKEGNEPGSSSQAPGPAGAAGKESFEETIRKTMERMQSSDTKATAEASTGGQDDFLEQMLKSMQGEGGDEDFSKMLLGMMEQLTNKEILYEPMKDLHDKFPGWMEKNKDKTPAADLARYQEQQGLVKEIVGRFERPGYSDENAEDREYIVERMQKVCIVASLNQSPLTRSRCKQLAVLLKIWLATWTMRKRPLVIWIKIAPNNDPDLNHASVVTLIPIMSLSFQELLDNISASGKCTLVEMSSLCIEGSTHRNVHVLSFRCRRVWLIVVWRTLES